MKKGQTLRFYNAFFPPFSPLMLFTMTSGIAIISAHVGRAYVIPGLNREEDPEHVRLLFFIQFAFAKARETWYSLVSIIDYGIG